MKEYPKNTNERTLPQYDVLIGSYLPYTYVKFRNNN